MRILGDHYLMRNIDEISENEIIKEITNYFPLLFNISKLPMGGQKIVFKAVHA